MPKFFLDDVYARSLAAEGHLEASRQSRSSMRAAEPVQSLGLRDQSASSSEQRSSSSRRNSIFLKRPKSAMTTRSSEASHGGDSRRSSTTIDMPVMPPDSDASRSRFLFGRSRKSSQSSGSRIRANSPTDAYDDGYGIRHRESKHKRDSSGGSRGSSKDLFSDLRALRRGHRTAVIGPSRTAQDEAQKEEPARPQRGPAPLRPKRSDEGLTPEQLLIPEAFGMQPLRQTRSAEQFSLGISPSQTTGPPKRPSHRPPPLNPALFPPMSDYNIPRLSNGSMNDDWDRLLPLYENRSPLFNPMNTYIGPMRSVAPSETVPDHIKSPIFHLPLEQVPEEPEGTLSNRQSKDVTHYPSIRHAKSSPMLSRNSSKSSFRKRSQVSPVHKIMARPSSQGSDTLGDPTRLPKPSHSSTDEAVEQLSTTPSWEDDIDYCYEHAAEAHCDFDWNNVSRYEESDHDDVYLDDGPYTYALIHKDISRSKNHSVGSTSSSSEGESYRLPNRVYKVPSKDALPELEYRSSPTNSVSLLTPLDKFSFPSSESRNSQRLSVKDIVSSQSLYAERTESQMNQLFDKYLAKVEGAPPAVPLRSEMRNDKRSSHEQTRHNLAAPLLPTPPPSADQSPVIPDDQARRQDLKVNTIVAALRRPLDSPVSPDQPPAPPPKSPLFRPRGRANTVDTRRLALCEPFLGAHFSSEDWPLSIPRSSSETSVVTAIPASKSPAPSSVPPPSKVSTPPRDVSPGAPFLTTPAPTPAFENVYFAPPRSTSHPDSNIDLERPQQMHRKGSSYPAPPKPDTPPKTPELHPQTGVRTSRSSYSLFPHSLKSPILSPSKLKSAKSMNFPQALKSAPVNGSFPSRPFSSKFDHFKHGPPPPKNAGFKARQRAFQIMP